MSRIHILSAILFTLVSVVLAQPHLLTPKRVAELARTQSVMVKSSRLDISVNEYSRKGAFARFLPSVSGNASYTRLDKEPAISMGEGSTIPDSLMNDPIVQTMMQLLGPLFSTEPVSLGPRNIVSLGFTIRQPLFLGGKLLNNYKSSKLNVASQVRKHERLLAEAENTGLKLFWSCVALQEVATIKKEERLWYEKLIATQEVMFETGMIIELALLNSKAELSKRKLEEKRAYNASKQMNEQLALFLNLPVEDGIILDTLVGYSDVTGLELPDEEEIARCVDKRDDVRALALEIDILNTVRKAQRSDYLPNIFGFYNHKFSNDDPQYDDDELISHWNVGVALDWKIFDWGATYRELQKTDDRLEQLKLAHKSLRDKIEVEIRDKYRNLVEKVESVEIAEKGIANARRALEIAELQYSEGLITDVELRNTHLLFSAARLQLVQAYTAREITLAEYTFARGD